MLKLRMAVIDVFDTSINFLVILVICNSRTSTLLFPSYVLGGNSKEVALEDPFDLVCLSGFLIRNENVQ